MKTKKAGIVGRFGAKYGRKIRLRVREIESQYRGKSFTCPNCSKKKLCRLSAAIWQCSKCNVKIAGGAYVPFMEVEPIKAAGKIVSVVEYKKEKKIAEEQ